MKTNYTYHAFKRVQDRISISPGDLAELLDANLVLNIGEEKRTNREHRLFYSEKDKQCFVAIQDMRVGLVITILPIDYHENIAWAVSIQSQREAKKLIVKETIIVDASIADPEYSPDQKTSRFRLSGNFVDEYGHYQKMISLGSWPSLPYDSVEILIKDPEFVTFLFSKIEEKKEKQIEKSFLNNVIIRRGKELQFTIISIKGTELSIE